jgi:electron transport complex protein RnfG
MTVKDLMKITLNLVIVYLVGGIILTAVYARTSPIIFIGEKKDKEEALKKMLPDAEVIEEMGTWESHKRKAGYYVAKKGDEDIGYIVESYGRGYQSYIRVLTAVDKNFIVQKIEILKHGETPGLGDEILKEPFKKQFTGKDLEHIKLVKVETQEYIQAVTGATISCRAVTEDAVKSGVKMLKERLEEKKV